MTYFRDNPGSRAQAAVDCGQTVGHVGGRIIDDGAPLTCPACCGQTGWTTLASGNVVHVACGTEVER